MLSELGLSVYKEASPWWNMKSEMSFTDDAGVSADGFSMLCCKKCRGLFLFADMLKDHVGLCTGDPRISECQLFACKKEWFVWCLEHFQTSSRKRALADSSDCSGELTDASVSTSKENNDVVRIKTEMKDIITGCCRSGSETEDIDVHEGKDFHKEQPAMPNLSKESGLFDSKHISSALGDMIKKLVASKPSVNVASSIGEIETEKPMTGKQVTAGLLPIIRHPSSTHTSSDAEESRLSIDCEVFENPASENIDDCILIDDDVDEDEEKEEERNSAANSELKDKTLRTKTKEFDQDGRYTITTRAGKEFYCCVKCGQGSGNLNIIHKHMEAHDMGTLLACRFCSFQTLLKGNMLTHESKHIPTACSLCDEKFKSKYFLKKHCAISHSSKSIVPVKKKRKRGPKPKGNKKKHADGDSVAENCPKANEDNSSILNEIAETFCMANSQEDDAENCDEYDDSNDDQTGCK